MDVCLSSQQLALHQNMRPSIFRMFSLSRLFTMESIYCLLHLELLQLLHEILYYTPPHQCSHGLWCLAPVSQFLIQVASGTEAVEGVTYKKYAFFNTVDDVVHCPDTPFRTQTLVHPELRSVGGCFQLNYFQLPSQGQPTSIGLSSGVPGKRIHVSTKKFIG